MAAVNHCILNNPAGSLVELGASPIGQSFVEVSVPPNDPDYIVGHFPGHNGTRVDTALEVVRTAGLTNVGFNTGEMAIGFWFKVAYAILNGVPADSTNRCWIDTYQYAPYACPGIQLFNFTNRFRFMIWWCASFSAFDITTNFTVAADTWTYALFVMDNSAAVKKRIVYLGDASSVSEITSSSANFTTVTMAGQDNKIRLGGQHNDTAPANMAFEDIKWFGGAGSASPANVIDILANRNTLGFPSGGFRLLDGAMKSPLIDQGVIN